MTILLQHPRIEGPIEFSESRTCSLVLEEPHLLRLFLSGVEGQIAHGDAFFRCYVGREETDFAKTAFFLRDAFDPALDGKKNNAAVQKDVCLRLREEDKDRFQQIQNALQSFLTSLFVDYPVPVEIDSETTVSAILKAFDLHPVLEGDTFLESLILKVRLLRHVSKKTFFLFYNLHDYLNGEELAAFQKEMNLLEIPYMTMLSHMPALRFPSESIIRIDGDLCEQHIDMKDEEY